MKGPSRMDMLGQFWRKRNGIHYNISSMEEGERRMQALKITVVVTGIVGV